MTPLRYHSIKKNAELIKLVCDECKIPKKDMLEFIQKAISYAYSSDTPSWASHMHSGSFAALAQFVLKLHTQITETRTKMKSSEPQTMRQRYSDSSIVQASTELKRCFPSIRSFHFEISTKPINEIMGREHPYYGLFVIPVHWYKSVYARGIASVKAGDGARFVLSAKPFVLERLERDHIRAYTCRTVKRPNRRVTLVQNEWVMRYSVDDFSSVTAAHKDFSSCESLLKRRIRDKVDSMLDAL
jgi:hypothetical protein